jgi:hypothetical protein
MTLYLTLASDVLGPRFPADRALSLFYCPEFDCRYDAHDPERNPGAALTALVHDLAPTYPTTGKRLVLGALTEDLDSESGKLGGQPFYIQDSVEGDLLGRAGFRFFFQIDDLSDGAAFNHGTVYVFARFAPEDPRLERAELRTFYQNS